MPDLVLGAAAVEAARTTVAIEARRVPALADALAAVPPGTFGGLAAGALADALARLRTALTSDLAVAGSRLYALDRALDATARSMTTTDRDVAAALRRAGPGPPGRPGG